MIIMLAYFLVYSILGAIITAILVPSIYALLEYSVTLEWDWKFFWGLIGKVYALFEIAVIISILIIYFAGGLTI